MKKKIIGQNLVMVSMLMLASAFVALYYNINYGEKDFIPLLVPSLATFFIGAILFLLGRKTTKKMRKEDNFLTVTLTWLILTVLGMIPYLMCGTFDNVSDAFFETMSGFTTTGASVLSDVEAQLNSHHSMLFWRSLSQWVGGLGIVFFTIAVLPSMVGGSMKVFSAEATGPIRSKMHPRLSTNAKWIWSVYLALTIGCFISYLIAGMDWFSAINYAMTTTATGGFSIHNDGITHFHSPAIEYIGMIFQFASGVNFTVLYLLIMKRQVKAFLKNSELRFYAMLVIVCSVWIGIILLTHNGYSVEHAFRSATFHVVSLMTTTGIFCDSVGTWPHSTWIILSILMFIGACAGSTSGGFKSVRVLMIWKVIKNEFIRLLHPRAVLPVRINGQAMPSSLVQNLLAFFAIYVVALLGTTAVMMTIGYNVTNSVTISLSCINNVGLPLNELGPDMTWNDLPFLAKWMCSLLMLMGRLEIFNVLLLLTPSYWKDN